MYRILLVEDDPGIAQAVCAHLRQWELDARSGRVPLFRVGEYEHRHGHEHGRG